MTRREFPIALAALCSARLHAHQSDFWVSKDASQWTAQEIDRLITNSPWAKEIKAGADGMSTGGRRGLRLPRLGGSRFLPGNGAKVESGSIPRFDAVVRWESAAPILDALKIPLPGILDEHYVIALCGIPPLTGSVDDVTPATALEVPGSPPCRLPSEWSRRVRTRKHCYSGSQKAGSRCQLTTTRFCSGRRSARPGHRAILSERHDLSRRTRRLTKDYDGRAPTAGLCGRISKRFHEWSPRQHRAYHLSLCADASSVDNPHIAEAARLRLLEIFLHDCLGISRRDGMQVEDVGDRNLEGEIVVHWTTREIIVPAPSCGNKTILRCSEAWLYLRWWPRPRYSLSCFCWESSASLHGWRPWQDSRRPSCCRSAFMECRPAWWLAPVFTGQRSGYSRFAGSCFGRSCSTALRWIPETSPSSRIRSEASRETGGLQALLIAFAFGAFIEGAAGFGAPVAVAAGMLAGLGFDPFFAAGICLLANTAPVAFGSIGIPVITLAGITGLPLADLSANVGRICAPVSLFIPAYLVVVMTGFRGLKGVLPAAAVCGISFASAQFLVSNFIGPQLTDILGSLAAMGSLVVLLKLWKPSDTSASERAVAHTHSTGTVLRAWTPYGLLVLLVC